MPEQFSEQPFVYTFQRTLTSGQQLVDASMTIDKDSEFIIDAIWGTQTGIYNVRIKGPNSRYLSSTPVRNANQVGTGQFPVLFSPPLRVPAGGQLSFDLTDLSAASNTIEICLGGVRRYPTV